jgi:hypothetical protein
MYSDYDTYPYYREIIAKRASSACHGKHAVKVGDVIGWNRRTKKVVCASCWRTWSEEVAEENRIDYDNLSHSIF